VRAAPGGGAQVRDIQALSQAARVHEIKELAIALF
jgi:hypothetical protein